MSFSLWVLTRRKLAKPSAGTSAGGLHLNPFSTVHFARRCSLQYFLKSQLFRSFVYLALVAALVAGSLGLAPAEPLFARAHQLSMFTQIRCLSGEHCDFVEVMDKDAYPSPGCYVINYDGKDFAKILAGFPYYTTLDLTVDAPASNGYRIYGWGVRTRFAALNPTWYQNSHWSYNYKC